MTTIGSLPNAVTKSNARATVSSLVRSPRMISTSFILCTGEKKCRPMKRSGVALACARPVIGRVEVFDANTPPAASKGSASRVTPAFSSRFSNTASMIRSQPFRSAASPVGVIRFSSAACRTSSSRLLTLRTASKPARAFSALTSFSAQAMPREAAACAMPAPIIPAPSTPTFDGFQRGTSFGRDLPDLIAFMLKKNAVTMFFVSWLTIVFASLRLSMRVAVS